MYLGIDIGGTFIKYALVNEEFEIIDKWKVKTKLCQTHQEFYAYLIDNVKNLNEVSLIGISAPGVINKQTKVCSQAAINTRIMYETNIQKEVMNITHIQTFAINDAKAAGYCEYRLGNAKNTHSSAMLILGTGIGGCLLDENGLINGKDFLSGELSCFPFMIKDGKIISAAHFASISALINMYNNQATNPIHYGEEVIQLYKQNDALATTIFDQWCLNIVYILNSIAILYNPEVICIGGGISEENWFIDKLVNLFKMHFPKRFAHLLTTKIVSCKYNNDSNILGVLLYANDQYNK